MVNKNVSKTNGMINSCERTGGVGVPAAWLLLPLALVGPLAALRLLLMGVQAMAALKATAILGNFALRGGPVKSDLGIGGTFPGWVGGVS